MACRRFNAPLLCAFLVGSAACVSHPPGWASLAAGNVRTLCAALEQYKATCEAYPDDLTRLAPPSRGAKPTCERLGVVSDAVLVESLLLSPRPSSPNYTFAYVPDAPLTSHRGGFAHYQLRATYIGKDRAQPSFWVSDAGRMTVAKGHPASASDEAMP
jgi:hypothetical protein